MRPTQVQRVICFTQSLLIKLLFTSRKYLYNNAWCLIKHLVTIF